MGILVLFWVFACVCAFYVFFCARPHKHPATTCVPHPPHARVFMSSSSLRAPLGAAKFTSGGGRTARASCFSCDSAMRSGPLNHTDTMKRVKPKMPCDIKREQRQVQVCHVASVAQVCSRGHLARRDTEGWPAAGVRWCWAHTSSGFRRRVPVHTRFRTLNNRFYGAFTCIKHVQAGDVSQ